MANPLTGDYEAVLQVSGGTLNRLMASMHQNAFADPDRPSFPHVTVLRLGDDRAIDGVRGTVWGQVSVPLIELIHRSTNSFWLEVDVRVRYEPDPGSVPLPEFIHGTVRAEYTLEEIDPSCWGWRRDAADYFWVRVVDDSVSFTGTAFDEGDVIHVVDEQAALEKINRQVRFLLRKRFEAAPQKVEKGFRPGSLVSLSVGDASVVATPIGLTRDPPPGRLGSINDLPMLDHHFAVAVSREYILEQFQARLDEIRESFRRHVHFEHRTYVDLGWFGDVDVLTVTIDYSVMLTSASAEWSALPRLPFIPPGGLVALKLRGEAVTSKPVFNLTFDVTQFVLLTFDESAGQISLSTLGAPEVHLGGTFADAAGGAKESIKAQVQTEVQRALDQLGGVLDLDAYKARLIGQLVRLDQLADARFTAAQFSPDGVVLFGSIFLTPRRRPVNQFGLTAEQDGYTALESWIPGGRIDRFDWSWTWSGSTRSPGASSREDRFVLGRPPPRRGKFGLAIGADPLPGLDGPGRVCLDVRGVQVDENTGRLVPVASGRRCSRFGHELTVAVERGIPRLLTRELEGSGADRRAREVGVREVGGPSSGAGSNTLVVYLEEGLDRETATTLEEGLTACGRSDAGLVVLLLLRDGLLEGIDPDLLRWLEELADRVGAPILANEDVRGRWSAALALPTGTAATAWRLISPGGGVSWMLDGPAASEELAGALDERLFPSEPPALDHASPGVSEGIRIRPDGFDLAELDQPCPPPPPGRGIGKTVVVFVQNSPASLAKLEQLGGDPAHAADSEVRVAVVVDGRDAEIERLTAELGLEPGAVADGDGVIADRFGVRMWPTTVTLNEVGVISELEIGADALGHAADEPADDQGEAEAT